MSENEQHKEENLHQENPDQKSEQTQGIDAETTEKQSVESDPVENLKDEVQDLKDQNLRLYAEFENFRKRTAKERLQMMDSANKDTLAALLPVLDDFDRALKNTEATPENEAVLEGLKLIKHKLGETLKNKGLIAMESTIGRAFDVEEMEAITQIPAPIGAGICVMASISSTSKALPMVLSIAISPLFLSVSPNLCLINFNPSSTASFSGVASVFFSALSKSSKTGNNAAKVSLLALSII